MASGAGLGYSSPVVFESFYLACLSHASYLIADGGEAAIVDPQRDVDGYIAAAERLGVRIVAVIETHLHADFVSGHRELAARTGARIYIGRRASVEFPHVAVGDGDDIRIGDTALHILETPGHTPEGICVLVVGGGDAARLLTGDTVFIGDVGRPDLAGGLGITPEEMAGMLYDSLHQKILVLPDDVEVWPAHGAGSACGRAISDERSATLGQQRRMNWALQPMPRADFVRLMTENLAPPPAYFVHDAEENRRGAPALADLAPARPLRPDAIPERAVLLDIRDTAAFARGHVPGSVNVALAGPFAPWAGAVIALGTPIVLVADGPEAVNEAAMRLARIGVETVVGFLDGGIATWAAAGLPVATLKQIAVADLAATLPAAILDVRRPREFAAGHLPGARSLPLDRMTTGAAVEGPPTGPLYVICASGYRSSAAASVLLARGLDVVNVVGGTNAWIAAGLPVET